MLGPRRPFLPPPPPAGQRRQKDKKELVIIAERVEGEALTVLVLDKLRDRPHPVMPPGPAAMTGVGSPARPVGVHFREHRKFTWPARPAG